MALNVKTIADALMTIEGLNITSVYNKSSEAMQRMGKDAVEDGYLVKGEDDENFVLENGSKFIVDWEEGQKTGFFLDQRNNRDLVRKLAKGKNVLNTFCYTGGFSVTALQGGANKVVSVDCSKKAILASEQNLILNGFSAEENPCVAEDAKLFLQNMKKGEFDLIILDPPAFAKNHRSLHKGLQGYKFINREAITKINTRRISAAASASARLSQKVEAAGPPDPTKGSGRCSPERGCHEVTGVEKSKIPFDRTVFSDS